jgi:hypothetical protein
VQQLSRAHVDCDPARPGPATMLCALLRGAGVPPVPLLHRGRELEEQGPLKPCCVDIDAVMMFCVEMDSGRAVSTWMLIRVTVGVASACS